MFAKGYELELPVGSNTDKLHRGAHGEDGRLTLTLEECEEALHLTNERKYLTKRLEAFSKPGARTGRSGCAEGGTARPSSFAVLSQRS